MLSTLKATEHNAVLISTPLSTRSHIDIFNLDIFIYIYSVRGRIDQFINKYIALKIQLNNPLHGKCCMFDWRPLAPLKCGRI